MVCHRYPDLKFGVRMLPFPLSSIFAFLKKKQTYCFRASEAGAAQKEKRFPSQSTSLNRTEL